MDEWEDDAYPVIYDEQDRERSLSVSNGSCCGGIFVFALVGLALVMSKGIFMF